MSVDWKAADDKVTEQGKRGRVSIAGAAPYSGRGPIPSCGLSLGAFMIGRVL